jgi:hypothetical protein
MYYPGGLNISKCCKQGLCTGTVFRLLTVLWFCLTLGSIECFLQVKKPSEPKSPCPFCQRPSFSVAYKGAKEASDLAREFEARPVHWVRPRLCSHPTVQERKRVESDAAEARAREESSPEARRMRQRASDILRTPVDIPSPPPSRPLPPVAQAPAQQRRPRTQRSGPAELFAVEVHSIRLGMSVLDTGLTRVAARRAQWVRYGATCCGGWRRTRCCGAVRRRSRS